MDTIPPGPYSDVLQRIEFDFWCFPIKKKTGVAMLGGILLGIIETFSKAYISTQFSDAIVFSVLIIILLVKPAGLLGKQIQEKV